MPQSPTCVAIILCEQVLDDVRTRNKTLVGTFNVISAPNLPAMHPRLAVFCSLTDGHGKVPISLRICCDKAPEKPLVLIEGQVEFPSPMTVVDLVFEVQNLVFQQASQHSAEIRSGQQILGVRRFALSATGTAAPPGGQAPGNAPRPPAGDTPGGTETPGGSVGPI